MTPPEVMPSWTERAVARGARALAGGRFPAFVLCVLAVYQAFIALMAFAPPGGGAWGGFVEDFRVRCFQLDPRSGGMRAGSIWVMLLEPVPLQLMVAWIWRGPLLALGRAGWRPWVPVVTAALLVVGGMAASLYGLGAAPTPAPVELAFPADRLRTVLPMPEFAFENQDGEPVTLEGLRGKVVLFTAVYATCTKTCPMMLAQIRTVVDALTPEERQGLVVVAFSLNPEADSRELRAMTARIYGMKAPRFHFVNGVPAEVERVLDELQVARERDAASGEIVHSNLFHLLDRQGRIAYRLSLSQREQSWLSAALRVLLAEAVPAGTTSS